MPTEPTEDDRYLEALEIGVGLEAVEVDDDEAEYGQSLEPIEEDTP